MVPSRSAAVLAMGDDLDSVEVVLFVGGEVVGDLVTPSLLGSSRTTWSVRATPFARILMSGTLPSMKTIWRLPSAVAAGAPSGVVRLRVETALSSAVARRADLPTEHAIHVRAPARGSALAELKLTDCSTA